MSSSLTYIGECTLGRGVFARQTIRQAETILRFNGPELTLDQALEKGDLSFNVLQIAPDRYLDIEQPGVSLNHSCEPNAAVVDDVVLIALRDIAPGEEITFDYSTTMSEHLETMDCLCGHASCRRVIGDFHDLPRPLKDRYLAARLVQRFIVAEHRERQRGDRHTLERSTGRRGLESCLRDGDVARGLELREQRCA